MYKVSVLQKSFEFWSIKSIDLKAEEMTLSVWLEILLEFFIKYPKNQQGIVNTVNWY